MKNLNTNIKNLRKLRKIFLIDDKGKKLSNGKIIFNKKVLYNFSSNDYLGLSYNKEIINSSVKWTKKFGSSLSSSRLISGNLNLIEHIEKKISILKNKERTIIMGSGFQCNSTVIPVVIDNSLGKVKEGIIFTDKLNHSSIYHGCVLSRQKILRYRHLDYNHLEDLLKKNNKINNKLIVSETVFSMDGDICNIDSLRFLAKKYNSILYLDEAHASGIFGPKGYGISTLKKNNNPNEIVIGTFSKAFGSYGSYVSCSKQMKEKIINFCAGLIYSTALPPSVLGAISKSTDLVPRMKKEREKLLSVSRYFVNKIRRKNFYIPDTQSQIIPLIFKDIKKCDYLSKVLQDNGFYILPIKPPTVPEGKSRLRISLTTLISKKNIDKFVDIFFKFVS